jgi:hypothetical protein
MGLPLGKVIPLSLARQLVCDWLHFSAQASYVSVERRMQLAPVAAARASASLRPGWFPIMLKAFALACRQHPELRRSYLSFPRPRLYEHAVSVAAMIMERDLDGEQAILSLQLAEPENRARRELDEGIRLSKAAPLNEVPSFRRALRWMRWPKLVRRLLWWYGLNCSGKVRQKHFGTFCVTSVTSRGADGLFTLSPMTSILCFGELSADKAMTVRVFFDHRVVDAGPVSRTLKTMEEILNGEIASELLGEGNSNQRAA